MSRYQTATASTDNRYFYDADDRSVIYRELPSGRMEMLSSGNDGPIWSGADAVDRDYLVPLPREQWHKFTHLGLGR